MYGLGRLGDSANPGSSHRSPQQLCQTRLGSAHRHTCSTDARAAPLASPLRRVRGVPLRRVSSVPLRGLRLAHVADGAAPRAMGCAVGRMREPEPRALHPARRATRAPPGGGQVEALPPGPTTAVTCQTTHVRGCEWRRASARVRLRVRLSRSICGVGDDAQVAAPQSRLHQSPGRVASFQTRKRPTVREILSPCRTCACAGRQAESWDMLQGAVRCASRQQGDIESARLSHFKYRNTAVWCAVRERASPYYYRLCLAQEASPT